MIGRKMSTRIILLLIAIAIFLIALSMKENRELYLGAQTLLWIRVFFVLTKWYGDKKEDKTQDQN